MSLIIGLTGSIASGKSTVSSMLAELNIPIVDADKIAREVVHPGEEAYSTVVRVFGAEILKSDQTLDRKKLGAIIFADEKKRDQLNNIIHPAIRKKMLEQRDAYVKFGEKCVVLDIPLLFESKLTHYIEKIIVVSVDEEVQLERLMSRDKYTQEEAQQRIKSQIPVRDKAKLADAVIDNNGTPEETYEQLIKLLKSWFVI